MSVANLHYDVEEEKYQLDLRMFIDDYLVVTGVLESESNYQPSLTMVPTKKSVRDYLSQHLFISINGKALQLKVDQVKVEELTIFVVFKAEHQIPPDEITSISVKDTIFVDEFISQRNVIHFDFPDKSRRSLLFNQYEREGTLEW